MGSIERHLLAWILGALSVGALLLVLVSYRVTLDEMDEIFDENLKQVTLAVASHYRRDAADVPFDRTQLPKLPHVYEEPGDFDYVTLAWSTDGRQTFSSDRSALPTFSKDNGLSRMRHDGEDWYVYTIVRDNDVLQVAQRASSRKLLAAHAASKLFPPLLLLIPLVGLLLIVALRRGLRPLDQAADGVAARSAMSLDPIDEAGLPREIYPLIRSINGLMRQLSEAFTAQRRFVADAAHELRSPVTALRLQLHLLEQAKDDESRIHAIHDLRAGIDRSQRLIEQLLNLSRVEPDAPMQRPECLDLSEIVRTTVSQLSAEADQKGIDLGADAVREVEVNADRHQLLVLLDNLVGNAIRYTPAGGTVDVRASLLNGRPVLQVIDSGPGIPEAERERVFDRFYRRENLQSDARSSGSGLGLAIVRAIAQRHGVMVSLHTASSGRGLEVRVLF